MAEESAVKVCVRVRPLIRREQDLGDATQLYWKTENRLISQIDGTKSFSFDRVFHSNETTEKVYEEIAVPIICSAIQGYNGTIFAYGQTASGKTYTMMGSADGLGVIPKAVNDIFKKIKEIPEREFLLRVSYMEIYNETITDLLCDTRKMKPLEIREDFNRNVYVADLTEEVVSTPELALQWIKKGERNRHYGKTKMNQRSSRSHTIFRMILESREKGDPSNCDGAVMVSHLNLVDLAGSERASQTGAEGVRLKEGCNINRSLFILGQVIKKLSDGQAGGFINYRDSKLTRILQNSLGGNAKTLIICTITPVSFDETLSTLQFASTAKYMKNTPHVNEVLDDEALLKRYRKEIIDLKKQLEEVSSETRVQAMEKDQLAQLLEEKDLLQKVQNDKIQNLTQMLVTSSSITLQQDLKAKRKRRVTWCPGKMNKMKDIGYIDDFDTTKAIVPMSIKPTIPSIVETDESLCSEFDVFSNTLETISESEWNPATKLNQIQEQDLLDSVQLCETIISEKETVQNELNLLRANFDNLVLDYEQLQRKKTEMELKLNEKLELDEFVTLEMQTIKEQENELNLKSQLLKEKEEQIKELQKLLELQRIENMKMDFSSSVENGEKLYEELKHLKQSLCDTETIALDAKKENAFLKSENQELKENMEELLNRCSQLEKENHLYQSQLKERRNISERRQADLERELQSAFNEITKLTSIIDGKYPKDLLLAVELERKVKDLQKDLDKEIEENEALRKEINVLSELKSLPTELEILRKELSEKTQHKTLEPEKLLEVREELCKAPQKLEKQLNSGISGLRTVEMEKQLLTEELHENLEGRPDTYEKGDLKQPQEILQSERDQFRNDSQDATDMAIKLSEGQNLDTPRNLLSLTDYEKDNELLQQQRQISSLLQEKNQLQQMLEYVTNEKNQLKTDLEENIEMSIENQEELRNIGAALKKQQEAVFKERKKTAEKEEELLRTQEMLEDTEKKLSEKIQELQEKEEQLLNVRKEVTEAQEKVNKMEELREQLKSRNSTLERIKMENLEMAQKLQASLEETTSITKEISELKKIQMALQLEKDQLEQNIKEVVTKGLETQEDLKIAQLCLKEHQETIDKLKECISDQASQGLNDQGDLKKINVELQEKIQELQAKQEQIVIVREEAQEKINEMEQLKEQLISKDSALKSINLKNQELIQKLQASVEEKASITEERDKLTKTLIALKEESHQLKQNIREFEAKDLGTEEELKIAQVNLKQQQETIDKLKECISEKIAEVSEIQEALEKTNTELQERIQELQEKKEQVLTVREEITEAQEKLNEVEHLKERIVMENLELAQKLQASLEEVTSVTEERDKLTKTQETLHIERDQLKETIRDLVDKDLETQGKLKIVQMHLKEHQQTIDKLKECISEKTTQVSEMQEALAKTNTELKKRELQEKTEQVFNVKEEVTEAQEKVKEVEHLKEQLKLKDYTLERIEIENMELTQKFQAILEKATSVTEERDGLTKAQEALHIERDQLKETIRDLVAKDLETQEKLKFVQMNLKEYQETIDKLKECVSDKTAQVSEMQDALEKTNAELKERIQELQEEKEQVFNVRKEVTEAREKMNEVEHLKEQLKSKNFTLERIEIENLELAQKLQASLEETASVTEERDGLTKTQEALQIERDQLKETIRDLLAEDQKIQEELKFAEMTIDKLKECISEKTSQALKSQEVLQKNNSELQEKMQMITDKLKEDLSEKEAQIFSIQGDLEKTNNELQQKILKLQETEEVLLSMRKEVNETKLERQLLCQLEEQLKKMNHTLSLVETEKMDLTQKLDASLSKMNTVIKERDALQEADKALQMEINQLKESLKKSRVVDQQKPKEVVNIEANTGENIKQHSIESLKEKYLQINELLKKYTMMENRYGFLSRLSLDLKKTFESQNELQVKIQTSLSHTPQQKKVIGKLLASNRRCNNDLHSCNICILKKLEGVLKRVIDIRKEHHNTINKFEKNLIEEAEKQNDLFIKIQHLQLHAERGSQELSSYKKLSQKMDLHIEQILKDVSETQNDIHSMVVEFQQLLNAKKDIILFLEMCLSTHLDVENLKKIIQEDSDRIVHVNNFYHNKIKAMMNESSEFEDRSAAACKEWELELRQMKDKNEEMLKVVQTTHLTLDGLDTLTIGENMKRDLKLSHTRQTTKEIQETAFHEDKENKQKIKAMQKNLEVSKVGSNKQLRSQQPTVQSQDIKAVSSKEIDDLKMQLVKLNMEKLNESKKLEKEIASKTAIIEHMEEIISQLKENLRRAQQCNNTSILEPSGHAQASHAPLTCGGGSGIIQSTKALILKADRVRLEREISKLKKQNEYLTNHQSQLSREVKKWKERALKKEAQELSCVHSPKSPKLAEMTSLKKQYTSPLNKEQISQETLPKDSPKSWAYDGRSKSLPVTCLNNYFDNSGLGLLPEVAFSSTSNLIKETQTPGEENTESLMHQWQSSSGKDAPECKTQ
ncbi:centromere-associated protein E isoform X1 [Sarcophilus harrisii]|uniref:centromere-associated protein E isoform X1 n=1 Tax=Sarcophilus harrisii TaxID=9305 RepID=UPI000C7CC755|nr:centromere-associated protein E isoform X1 [Sarcophilus harrisii]